MIDDNNDNYDSTNHNSGIDTARNATDHNSGSSASIDENTPTSEGGSRQIPESLQARGAKTEPGAADAGPWPVLETKVMIGII